MFHHFTADHAPQVSKNYTGGELATIENLPAACLPNSGTLGWRITEPSGETDLAYGLRDMTHFTLAPGGYYFLRAYINVRQVHASGNLNIFALYPSTGYWGGGIVLNALNQVKATALNAPHPNFSTPVHQLAIDRWHRVDALFRRGTRDGATENDDVADGEMYFWVDGELVGSFTTLRSYTKWVGQQGNMRYGLMEAAQESIIDYGPITIADFMAPLDHYFPKGQRPPPMVPYRICNIP